jgi:hypothetical protein
MRTLLTALTLAAGISLVADHDAGAVPADAAAVKDAIADTTAVQPAFYLRYARHHGIRKCYHELIIGPYVCHTFYRWGW